MRKIVLLVLIVAVLVSAGLYAFSRTAPDLLRGMIERAINKTVRVEAIEYRFPWRFELRGFKILETREPFVNEVCFSVDKVLLDVSPLSLSRNKLILETVDVNEAQVVIRKRNGKLLHALSDAMNRTAGPAAGLEADAASPASQLPLKIHRFHLGHSHFRLIDYDVQDTGFVLTLDQIEAEFRDIAFPATPARTHYRAEARLAQGRQKSPALFKASGWTVFDNDDTDALLAVSDLYLPYFAPYYAQVTAAQIEEGKLSTRSAVRISDRSFTANIDLEAADLYFRSYEANDELFGLKAEELLSFLKDSAGRLKFQIVLQWDLARPGAEKRDLIRRAFERSLKKTLLSNAGNVLEKTLQKLSDSDMDQAKDEWEDTLKKVKKLFR